MCVCTEREVLISLAIIETSRLESDRSALNVFIVFFSVFFSFFPQLDKLFGRLICSTAGLTPQTC